MNDFKGKTAVVTGAASGIGLALARHCLAQGMQVVMADIDDAALDRVCGSLPATAGSVEALAIDVASEPAVRRLAERSVERFGKVHLLFNNAGVGLSGKTWESSANDWLWVFGVHVLGVAHALRYFIPHMLRHGEPAHVVNTAAASGLTMGFGQSAFQASRHALVSLSESLHTELRMMRGKIGVSVLCPGFARSNILSSEQRRPAALKNHPPSNYAPQDYAFRDALQAILQVALTPEQIAAEVFAAIADNRFYILPDAEFHDLIADRAAAIVACRNPALPMLP